MVKNHWSNDLSWLSSQPIILNQASKNGTNSCLLMFLSQELCISLGFRICKVKIIVALIMYVKLPDGVKVISQSEEVPPQQNGVTTTTKYEIVRGPESNDTDSDGKDINGPRRSVRQALRMRKKKFPTIPKITIKSIMPHKEASFTVSEKPSDITPIRTGNTLETNGPQNSSSSSENGTKSDNDTSSLLTNGESGRRKTLREYLAGLPGFSMKPRKRSNKKLSHAAQIAQTREGCIDLESPDSILGFSVLQMFVHHFRIYLFQALISKHTFSLLPPNYQFKLINLLPECDKIVGSDGGLRISSTALNNEFFTKSCQEWRERLKEGEFTPENQQRIKMEVEREQSKIDPWKAKNFEPIWGQKTLTDVPKASSSTPVPKASSPLKVKAVKKSTLVSTMLKQRTISQTVLGSTVSHAPSTLTQTVSMSPGGLLMKVQTSKPTSVSIGEEKTVSKLVVAPVLQQVLKRPALNSMLSENDNESLSIASPPKQQKLSIQTPIQHLHHKQPQQAQAKTLAQIRAQTQAARMQKVQQAEGRMIASQAGVAVTHANVVQQGHVHSPEMEAQTPKIVVRSMPTTPLRSPSGTRTLAQIKAQTQAARAHGQGHTRTLDQIKAQTKARVQMHTHSQKQVEAQAKLHAHLLAKAHGITSPATTSSRIHIPNIILPPQGRPKQTIKLPIVKSDSTSEGVNIKRSIEICKQALALSQRNSNSSMVSLLPKGNSPELSDCKEITDAQPHQTQQQGAGLIGSRSNSPTLKQSVSKILFSQGKPPTSVAGDTVRSGISTTTTTTTNTSINTSVFGAVPQNLGVSGAPTQKSGGNSEVSFVVLPQGLSAPGNSSASQHRTVFTVPGGQQFIVTSGLTNSVAGSTQTLLQQLIQSGARIVSSKASAPQRAASAPPQNRIQRIPTPVGTIVRSASVGTTDSSEQGDESNSNRSENVVLQIPQDQVNFLSKTGTTTVPGRDGSRTDNRPVVVTSFDGDMSKLVVSGGIQINCGSAKTMSQFIVGSEETQGGKIITKSVSGLNIPTISNVKNVHVISAGSKDPDIGGNNVLIPTFSMTNVSTATSTAPTGQPSSQTNCACSLKAMVTCRKCGAFCHDDCIGPSKLCVTCLITT
ncbi:hypothetical protein ACJMK2_041065 [Sinanodonta woodiana]|uniref:DEUBAD domain-containing protein n=1 Tax=Sinanodonta woodiana TaxID=1069815 RepID=A0ABD3W2X1_SINWO